MLVLPKLVSNCPMVKKMKIRIHFRIYSRADSLFLRILRFYFGKTNMHWFNAGDKINLQTLTLIDSNLIHGLVAKRTCPWWKSWRFTWSYSFDWIYGNCVVCPIWVRAGNFVANIFCASVHCHKKLAIFVYLSLRAHLFLNAQEDSFSPFLILHISSPRTYSQPISSRISELPHASKIIPTDGTSNYKSTQG